MAIDIENPGANETDLRVALQNLVVPAPDTVTDAAYSFVLGDRDKTKIFSSGSAQTLTIPANSSVAFPIRTKIRCLRTGTGLPTFAVAGGVTLRKPTGIKPNRFMGAKVAKSADQTTADYSAYTLVTWDTERFDTDGFHDNVTNNSRLTIPSGLGITKVQFASTVLVSSTSPTNNVNLILYKDGVEATNDFYAGSDSDNASGASVRTSFMSSPISVTSGYFEVAFLLSVDTSITFETDSSFSVEVIEINPVGTIAYQYGYVDIEKIGTDEWIIYGPALG